VTARPPRAGAAHARKDRASPVRSPSARAVALEALARGGVAAEHLDRALDATSLSPADRAFATELVYGTIKMRRSLEWSVSRVLHRPFAQVEPRLRWILLLGAYQLLYLDRVPAHSAVDESVELAAMTGRRGMAGFANAVLRKVGSDRMRPPPPTQKGGAQSLALHASLPDWIARHLIDRFGIDDAVRAADGLNRAPRRALRMDDAAAADELRRGLGGRGGQTPASRYGIPECVLVDRASADPAVRDAIAHRRAAWQSEESQLAVHLLDPRPGETVLDMCCGRGVKTMMIAGRMRGEGALWSIDDDERKLASLSEMARARGFAEIHALRADARAELPAHVPDAVDAAIIDAPCSGLGIIGRRPEARWRKRESDPERFARVQAAVLRRTANHVRTGGRLLYVTCSTSPQEDEEVVDAFLAERPEWVAAPLPLLPSDGVRKAGEYLLTVPGIDGSDGFFYALLLRRQKVDRSGGSNDTA